MKATQGLGLLAAVLLGACGASQSSVPGQTSSAIEDSDSGPSTVNEPGDGFYVCQVKAPYNVIIGQSMRTLRSIGGGGYYGRGGKPTTICGTVEDAENEASGTAFTACSDFAESGAVS